MSTEDSPVDLPSTNLVDVIRFRAKRQPDDRAFTFLHDGENEEEQLSFAEFDRHARLIAACLQAHKAAGQRVLLLYPPGIQFVTAFFGCFYAGAVAVPAYPPRLNGKLTRLQAIAADAQPALVLTNQPGITRLKVQAADLKELSQLQWLDTGELLASEDLVDQWIPPQLDDQSLAFLQYTSGSTGQPKGVMISHRNLIHNQRVIKLGVAHPERGCLLGWLPLYHDMGLIGNVMHSVYTGSSCVLMSPVSFIQRPVRWLEAITRYRPQISGGPSFAYDLCVRKVTPEQRETLDLSGWRIAFNGAEPVRIDVLERFVETFASCGFRRDAFHACYGLAEATLMVSARPMFGPPVTRTLLSEPLERSHVVTASPDDTDKRTFVGCGRSWCDQQIKIVNPDTRSECSAGSIGEIWVRGESVAQGYWNHPEQTAEVFHAELNTGEGPFLRTGDLGFLDDDELFVTGRLKDLIIVNGRNHYPQDIEQTIEQSYPGIRPGCIAAFAVEVDGEERVVTVQEIERTYLRSLDHAEVEAAIRSAVSVNHELELHAVVLVKAGSIPKTTSGKLQRRLCARMFTNGEFAPLNVVKSSAPKTRDEMQFSLLYFSSNEADFSSNKYELLIEGARFADQHDFTAIWVPERHFHAFGGLYPNPSVLGAALATITKQIRIRAGSVVLPLHNPIRVAEEWSIVDNLSDGRVDLAFARGWNPNDFVLAPDNYAHSTEILFNDLQTVRRLWQGETLALTNGAGAETEIKIHPLPKQRDLSFWITCSGGAERFREAGACGGNVLTALLFQSIDELTEKIAAYREARAKHGLDPKTGHVTLMLHTFIDRDPDVVRRTVRAPFIDYMKTSVSLWRHGSKDLNDLDQKQQKELLEFAFERYYQTSALFGTPASCLATVKRLRAAGVDEIACLIDFGIDTKRVLLSLEALNELRLAANRNDEGARTVAPALPVINEPIDDRELVHWLQTIIVEHVAGSLQIDPQKVPLDKNFYSLGVSSLKAVEIMDALGERLGVSLSPTILFEAPTVPMLASHFAKTHSATLRARMQNGAGVESNHREPKPVRVVCATQPRANKALRDRDVAVIGMGCRFPQAPDLKTFWELLRDGKDAITEVPLDHWDWRPFYDTDQTNGRKTYSRWGGFLSDIDQFDPFFFNISHREARLMDPQQRIFLEVAWETFEHAGYSPENLSNTQVGVFVGSSNNGYYHRIAPALTVADHAAGVGNQNSIIANRVSFLLNLRGPSILVDTMCSSSLVALHLALQSLQQEDCEVALAGGVNVLLSPEYFVAMSRMKAHAPDGRCKTFDHRADGIVFGEGAGAVLLKPLRAALRDRDTIYAVIKGSAVNHGGQTNGLTAPNPEAHAQLLARALERADVKADSISYLEAHGTGTSLGDPIEIEGASRAFSAQTNRKQFCAIGSVKTNIGHLEPAAGVSGLIKVILAMQHRQLPPTLHFEKPNPIINFDDSPFRVNTELRPWDAVGPRRAGVSSFGIGGSNAHVIVEEAPPFVTKANEHEPSTHLLTLSAKSETALQQLATSYITFLLDHPEVALADVCYTTNAGRSHFRHRLAAVVSTREHLVKQLQAFVAGESSEGLHHGEASEAVLGQSVALPRKSGLSLRSDKYLNAVASGQTCARDVRQDFDSCTSDPTLLALDSLALSYVAGAEIDWRGFENGYEPRRVALPTYPFERERCWIDVDVTPMLQTPAPQVPGEWFYELEWQPREIKRAAGTTQPRSWIIFADADGLGASLAQHLRGRGAKCVTIDIAQSSEADFDRLLTECRELKSPCAVLYLWPLVSAAGDDASLKQAQQLGCAGLVRLVQAMDRQTFAALPHIWVVTAGAQLNDATVSPAQSLVWGLGRVLSLERPQIWGGLIDLEPDTPLDDRVNQIVDHVTAADEEDQVAFRQGRRLAPRLVHCEPKESDFKPRSDATYLITGGLGNLGLKIARWLVDHGAQDLALLSRRQQSSAELEALQASGAHIRIVNADVSDEAAMASVFAELKQTAPPIRGIIHAAGVQTRQSIGELDLDQFADVLRPKVTGGWLLHKLTRAMELDFLIFFSSMSAVLGSVDLAHYAAANHFLDALAHHRRALGLPGLSINWGPWAEGGMVTSGIGAAFAQLGVKPLAPELALAALPRLIGSASAQVTVADIDWQTFKPIYESRRSRPMLAEIAVAPVLESQPTELSALAHDLVSTPESERHKLLHAHISGEVASILGQDLARLPLKQTGFFEMGMDSLMAMELKRRLELSLGCTLAPTLTFDYPNIARLVDHLLHDVLSLNGKVHSAEWLRSQSAEQVLATVETLSDEEALSLLEEKLQMLEGNLT